MKTLKITLAWTGFIALVLGMVLPFVFTSIVLAMVLMLACYAFAGVITYVFGKGLTGSWKMIPVAEIGILGLCLVGGIMAYYTVLIKGFVGGLQPAPARVTNT